VFSSALTVANKEILETIRDPRALTSSLLYTLMGPLVVGLLTLSQGHGSAGSDANTLFGLASVFALIAAFTGGMNVAMDCLAGERERRSLLPLLMNPLHRRDIVLGKWMAISIFAIAGVLANISGFAIVLAHAKLLPHVMFGSFAEALLLGLVPLAILAASAELFVSTFSRSIKEAHTYIAFIVFVPMGLGMFIVFFPNAMGPWWYLLPVVGQQLLLARSAHGGYINSKGAVVLGVLTLWLALVLVRLTARLLQRDEIVYGH
jgi:sodium transport system permease protein